MKKRIFNGFMAVALLVTTLAGCSTTPATNKTQSDNETDAVEDVATEETVKRKYQNVYCQISDDKSYASVLVIVDDAESEFDISFGYGGTTIQGTGTIEDGNYIANKDSNTMLENALTYIQEALTDNWASIPESDGTIYTVTLDSGYDKQNGNTLEIDGATPISCESIKRFGYDFTGWYRDEACTEPVAENPFVTEDTTIYAGWTEWDEQTMELMNLYQTTMEQAEYMMLRKPAYESTSFDAMYEFAFTLFLAVEAGGVVFHSEDEAGLLFGTLNALQNVQQVANPDDYAWYIWGDNGMAVEENSDNYEFYGYLNNEKFTPFLTPFMLEDQSQVKGNIILVSGGAFFLRSNLEEAYPSALKFNELGYNVFVLQRRVLPYNSIDSGLDLQRAIRYLKYNADNLGIANIDNLAAGGYSGGGGTVFYYSLNFYGDITPDSYYSNYIPDEIDSINSDIPAILSIYSAMATFEDGVTSIGVDPDTLEYNNENWPATFIVSGASDVTVDPSIALKIYNKCSKLNPMSELHLFANAPHGFGSGYSVPNYMGEGNWLDGYTGASAWIELADTFLMQVFELTDVTF